MLGTRSCERGTKENSRSTEGGARQAQGKVVRRQGSMELAIIDNGGDLVSFYWEGAMASRLKFLLPMVSPDDLGQPAPYNMVSVARLARALSEFRRTIKQPEKAMRLVNPVSEFLGELAGTEVLLGSFYEATDMFRVAGCHGDDGMQMFVRKPWSRRNGHLDVDCNGGCPKGAFYRERKRVEHTIASGCPAAEWGVDYLVIDLEERLEKEALATFCGLYRKLRFKVAN